MILDGKHKRYSQHQIGKLMEEVDSEKVTLFCGKHQYVADLMHAPGLKKGHAQCAECWNAYYTKFVAAMPPHTRQQVMEGIQELAHEIIQNPNAYRPFLHPEVTIVKDDPSI